MLYDLLPTHVFFFQQSSMFFNKYPLSDANWPWNCDKAPEQLGNYCYYDTFAINNVTCIFINCIFWMFSLLLPARLESEDCTTTVNNLSDASNKLARRKMSEIDMSMSIVMLIYSQPDNIHITSKYNISI